MTNKVLYTPAEVNKLLTQGSAVVVDVRDPEFYAEEHIPGAVNIPDIFYYLSQTSPEGLIALEQKFTDLFSQAGITPDKTVILYEESMDSRYGSSCRGYWLLSYLGHPQAGILNGGLMAWAAAGLPLDSHSVTPDPTTFTAKPRSEILATQTDVLQALAESTVILLDDRDNEEWVGKSSSPYGIDFAPRKGRLPGAKWIEWTNFMDQSLPIPVFKSGVEIRDLCLEKSVRPDDNIIIYCFKGARASNTYVALKEAGFKNLRIYFGSWNEWSRDPVLPIDEIVIENQAATV